jgi:hypothetical protein
MNARLCSGCKIALVGILLLSFLNNEIIPGNAEGTNHLYLPVVFSPEIVFLNGDFESGAVDWILDPEDARLIFSQNELPLSFVAHSGSNVAWLGNHETPNLAATNSISQLIQIPASKPVLNFWLMKHSQEHCTTSQDKLQILVNHQLFHWWELCEGTNTYSWSFQSISMKNYSGQTIYLTLQVVTDSSLLSEVYLDDFIFTSE